MLVDLEYTHKRPSEFARWFDEIWREIYFYIKSNERLEEVFFAAYKEDNTDFRQLYYVAKRFADRYADMLRLGLHLKTVSVYPDFADMQKKILRIIDQSIEQFSSLPQRAIDRIEQNIALEIEKHSVIDGYIDFPDILTIDEKELNEISSELHMIKESFEAKFGPLARDWHSTTIRPYRPPRIFVKSVLSRENLPLSFFSSGGDFYDWLRKTGEMLR